MNTDFPYSLLLLIYKLRIIILKYLLENLKGNLMGPVFLHAGGVKPIK
jgi:hypothetical protein